MTEPAHELDPTTYPAVEAAQMFVIPSYQWMLARVEAADSRIQTLLGFVITVTLAVATLGRSIRSQASLDSGWFIGALLLALATVLVGTIARLRGAVALVSPAKLYDHSLHLSPWRFQVDSLYYAARHFEHNKQLVRRKNAAVTWMAGLFVAELALVLVWLTRA